MKGLLLFLGSFVCGLCAGAETEPTPVPTIALALTINDAVTTTVYRDWPLIVRGDVVLMDDVTAPVADDIRLVAFKVVAASGAASPWPFNRSVDLEQASPLGPGNEAYQTAWFLTAEQTRGLSLGTYEMTLVWGDRKSPTLRLKVEEAPAGLSPDDEIRKATITSRVALLMGDVATGLAVLTQASARQPNSVGLWVSIAQLHEQQGNYSAGLEACQQALDLIIQKTPNLSHPPTEVMSLQGRLLKALLKASPHVSSPAPLRSIPTSNAPATVTSAPFAPPLVAPSVVISAPTTPPLVLPAKSTLLAVGVVVPASEFTDAKVVADATGQWAVSATAGSQYDKRTYSAAKAMGAPDVSVAGNSPDAWCPAGKNEGTDWLEVSFAKPVYATEVRVRQNDTVGAIAKIEAIDSAGTVHVWWEGIDSYKASATREIVWFAVRVPKTAYLVAKVKITLNLATVPGWKQFDAVQLVGVAQ